MIDLFYLDNLLNEDARAELLAELEEAASVPSTVLSADAGGALHQQVRRSRKVVISGETRDLVKQILMQVQPYLERRFNVRLGECEDPQFLRYEEGDFFVPHQDGNTPLVHDESRFRRVSAVIFLSRPSAEQAPGAYGGGELVFHGGSPGHAEREAARADPGTLVAFRSETTHEVTAVTHGVRYTIAAFFRGAN
jgi:SM-20-related protein